MSEETKYVEIKHSGKLPEVRWKEEKIGVELRKRLDESRISNLDIDTSRGLAFIFEDRPSSPPVGVFTLPFAEKFCKETEGYTWREL